MKPTTTLLIAPALAPLTGDEPLGCAVRDLARALQLSGWKVSVVVAVDPGVDTNRIGLARRLEPLTVGTDKLVVHEGSIESGDIDLLALGLSSPGASASPDPATCLRAALALGDEVPQVVQVWPSTQAVDEVLGELDAPPRLIVHLDRPGSLTHPERADLILLPSKAAAHKERRKSDSPLAQHKDKIFGMPPGCDLRQWNPARDSVLRKPLNPPTVQSKQEAKQALRAELGLRDEDVPLIGVVSKFTRLPRAVGEELLGLPMQMVGVQAGPDIEALAARAPQSVACPRALTDYETRQLRHRIIAAADFVLMPGTTEPVSQLFPCRYGSAVIAEKTGEFADRLATFDPRSQTGTGFLYVEPHEIVSAFRQAILTYRAGEETRQALIEHCLRLDLSWDTVAMRLNELTAPLLHP